MINDYISDAIEIISKNDRGGYTIPTSKLYPYQWNWDSAFTALGLSTFNRWRAWIEISTLLDGQWNNGMLPNIIFRQNDPDYFPGPEEWLSKTEPPSSGHSQPPVLASVVWQLVRRGTRYDIDRAQKVFGSLLNYHRWFIEARDPNKTGVLSVIHPWESGRDNSPEWDDAMDNISINNTLKGYNRRDTSHVADNQRPTKKQYDRFMTIVYFGRDNNWDDKTIFDNGPFLVADPGVHFIMLRANRDLLSLATQLGRKDDAIEVKAWIQHLENGAQKLWNPEIKSFCARDMRTGRFSGGVSSASLLCFYADIGTEEQKSSMSDHCQRIFKACKYGVPSWDPENNEFDSKRYWRGPVWSVVNYLVYRGFKSAGLNSFAEKIRHDTLRLFEISGAAEYYDPNTAEGLGGSDFTWTAAIYLELSKSRIPTQLIKHF